MTHSSTSPSASRTDPWSHALAVQQQAVTDFAETAEAVPEEVWTCPLAPGKWTPAQICDHLKITFDVLLDDLAGGPGMRVLPKRWQLPLLRWTMLPKLLKGGAFPRVRAPREIRPTDESDGEIPRDEAVASFRERAGRFEEAARGAHRQDPKTTLAHAYFGRCTLDKAVLLCARHIQHHQRQLA